MLWGHLTQLVSGTVRAGFLEEVNHGPSHELGLFQVSDFLKILGFSTHFPASHITEKTETRDTQIPAPPTLASYHIPSSSFSPSFVRF